MARKVVLSRRLFTLSELRSMMCLECQGIVTSETINKEELRWLAVIRFFEIGTSEDRSIVSARV